MVALHPSCPADPRAQQSRWGFKYRGLNEEEEIVVSCSVHKHNSEEEEIVKLVAAEEARVAAEVAHR